MQKIKGFIEFSKQSIDWCKKESEKSIIGIMEIMNKISDDATRVSKVSQEALNILEELKSSLSSPEKKPELTDITSILRDFKYNNQQVDSTIHPIISALQFQDRISQNFDNIKAMLTIWWEARNSEISLEDFGSKLLSQTKMEEERDIIHGVIEGLPKSQGTQKTAIVF